uniref:Fe2OG dioxygenase domain-containing protein n=1 Tax=Aureoumbra lagunensis TaxID=44058 RepID=A0A7S3K3Q3_9STRA
MIDDPALAAMLWKRITLRFPIAKNNRGWEPVALNERLRFLRYHPDDYFKQHSDGCFVRSDSERSLMTCMLYLNETQAQAGGETHFYQGYDTRVATVIPKPGRCLLFAHQLVHESALLKSGLKFAIRTDVMFRKN